MFERYAASREVLCKSNPRREIELVGFLELRQISVQARALGQQPENAALIEHVDMVLPDHVIDGREFLAIAHQRRSEAGHAVFHEAGLSGTGRESAKPARYTGCGKLVGATSAAAPRGSTGEISTEPSVTI